MEWSKFYFPSFIKIYLIFKNYRSFDFGGRMRIAKDWELIEHGIFPT